MSDASSYPCLIQGLAFAEAPRWHRGELWFSDFYTHQVMRVDREGRAHVVVAVPNQPSPKTDQLILPLRLRAIERPPLVRTLDHTLLIGFQVPRQVTVPGIRCLSWCPVAEPQLAPAARLLIAQQRLPPHSPALVAQLRLPPLWKRLPALSRQRKPVRWK